MEVVLGVQFELVGQDPVVVLCNIIVPYQILLNHYVLYPLILNLEPSMTLVC